MEFFRGLVNAFPLTLVFWVAVYYCGRAFGFW